MSQQIAAVKNVSAEKIENKQVEDELLASMAEYSQRIGLDPELGKNFVRLLIESSKLVQTESTFRKKIQAFLQSEKISKISIVGAGRMGSWFARYFSEVDVPVAVYDEDHAKAMSKAREQSLEYADSLVKVATADLVIVAVPIAKTPGTIRELSRIIAEKKEPLKIRVLEVSSVKTEMGKSLLKEDLAANEKIDLYSIHPLFGAGTNMYGRNTIVQVSPEDTRFVKGLFPHYTIDSLDWQAHDELMVSLLTIPHSLALVFADFLAGRKLKEARAFDMKTPSFAHMLELSRRVLGENPEVYFEIEAANPNTDLALSNLLGSLNKLRKSLESRDAFVRFFEDAQSTLEEQRNFD